MAQIVYDRVGEYTTTDGAGTYELNGTRVSGHYLFVEAVANGSTVECCVAMGDEFEIGTYGFATGASNNLSRQNIRISTNGNNPVTWGAGTKEITLVVPADRIGFVKDGSAGAPARSYYSSPLTGEYLVTTNVIGWSINAAGKLRLDSTSLSPITTGGLALGTTSLGYSGACFSSGATINFNAGDVVLTHSANTITWTGATTYSFDAAISGATVAGAMVATQANMETGTATNLVVSPGVQKNHPAHPKAWAFVSFSGGTPSLAAQHGFSGLVDTTTGETRLTLSPAMSGTNYAIIPGQEDLASGKVQCVRASSATFDIKTFNSANAAADSNFFVAVLGDQ